MAAPRPGDIAWVSYLIAVLIGVGIGWWIWA